MPIAHAIRVRGTVRHFDSYVGSPNPWPISLSEIQSPLSIRVQLTIKQAALEAAQVAKHLHVRVGQLVAADIPPSARLLPDGSQPTTWGRTSHNDSWVLKKAPGVAYIMTIWCHQWVLAVTTECCPAQYVELHVLDKHCSSQAHVRHCWNSVGNGVCMLSACSAQCNISETILLAWAAGDLPFH